MERHFGSLMQSRWDSGFFSCVGPDTEEERLPSPFACRDSTENGLFYFNEGIVTAVGDIVGAIKPNAAFYEAEGDAGWRALRRTIQMTNHHAPRVPVILDGKRADIGNTNRGYVRMAFEWLGVDAITVHPYLGAEALEPFLDRDDKGIIVLCRTSNPGAKEFQDRLVLCEDHELEGMLLEPLADLVQALGWRKVENFTILPLYQLVALRVAHHWNTKKNCWLVVGATFPDELKTVRRLVGDRVGLLIPGVGKQGGDAATAAANGADSMGWGFAINSSSAVIYASAGYSFAIDAHNKVVDLNHQIREGLTRRRSS